MKPQNSILKTLRWPLRMTQLGMLSERFARAFWPLWSLGIACFGALMLGVVDALSSTVVSGCAASLVILMLGAFFYGARRFSWPTDAAVRARLDASLVGQPIAALLDEQAIGGDDAGSIAVWQAHRARMEQTAAQAQAVAPDLRVSKYDPYGMRFIALLVFLVAVIFGSVGRVTDVGDLVGGDTVLAVGPTWEGWVEPPAYTGKPSLYLADIADVLSVPDQSVITLRLYGKVGALQVFETIGKPTSVTEGRTKEIENPERAPSQSAPNHSIIVAQSGDLEIAGPNGRKWRVEIVQDTIPIGTILGPPDVKADGTMSQRFLARDDYEVTRGTAVAALDMGAVDRRFGLKIAPEERDVLVLDLPMPVIGDRAEFEETLVENLSMHPWANLPVTMQLILEDARGKSGKSAAVAMVLPGRRFFDPLAAAVIEMRRDLLWSRKNAGRVAQVIRAMSHRPDGFFHKDVDYLRLRIVLRRLETMTRFGGLEMGQRDEITQALWALALRLEDGDLSDALEQMRRAQERLSEAIKKGATEEEIADLMQDLRDATQEFLRKRGQQQAQENEQGNPSGERDENAMQMTQQDIQKMMDRIQDLMEQGRTAEAQQALDEFQEMMENMRVTENGQGGEQSAGEQAAEGLSDTLREQQGLTDQAFRDLQEQFNPNANSGESQDNEGQSGGQGRGESHEGQGGERGREGQGDQEDQSGQQGVASGQGGGNDERSLADRQQALRDELARQQQELPGAGTAEGDAAREALDRAAQAMEQAENALRNNGLAEAIDQQSQAMEALRQGLRNLDNALAQQQRERSGQQGQAAGQAGKQGQDPLGRSSGPQSGGDENLLLGEDVYRRAHKLLDEIRRRSGDTARPDAELEYLKRLLERF